MSNDLKKYCIGGGITGLIWNFYNPDYTIITPQIGGDFGKNHLVWLHDTSETRKLLKDLGWEHPEKLAKKSYIGYYYKGWIMDNQTDEMNLLMIQKKMTSWENKIDTSFMPKTRDMSLSVPGGTSYMNTLDVDLKEVVRRLESKAKITNGIVREITDKTIKVEYTNDPAVESYVIPYDNIVSSIPAPVFWQIYEQPQLFANFKSLPITSIITKVKPHCYDDRFEMVYYDSTFEFSRISHIDGAYALEFTGVITKEQFEKMFPELPIDSYFVTKYGRIFENEENISPQKNIIFSGRFAQWKYGTVVESVIKQVIDNNLNK